MSYIKAIASYIPEVKVGNDEIEYKFPEWHSEKIFEKIGIKNRYISKKDEFVSDMSVNAIENLLRENNIEKETIDYLILCTQSPDYFLPTTACIVQDRVGLSKNCGAIDVNQGCSGYIYSLSLADALVSTGNFNNVLIVTAETYSKYIHENDKGNISLFGDAATATLVSNSGKYKIGKFSLGTDGSGYKNLIVKNGAAKYNKTEKYSEDNYLFMDGSEIFKFATKNIPPLIKENMLKNEIENLEDLDLFIFHQANTFMLNFLRKRIGIPEEKFVIDMEDVGNTVSSTIPLSLQKKLESDSNNIMLVGFGVGYSWGAVCIEKN